MRRADNAVLIGAAMQQAIGKALETKAAPAVIKQREQQRPPKNAKQVPRAQHKSAKRITKANYLRG